jgi:prepilin-type N-terminal cleavage/methylation domain
MKVREYRKTKRCWMYCLEGKIMRKRNSLKNKGFSLVELIIVIAIMAILAAAIAPALVRYIEKSRKAVDLQNAEMIYEAANLAAATSDDDAAAGWAVCQYHDDGKVWATNDGHRARDNSTASDTYVIRPVAWARGTGMKKGDTPTWENTLFKATMDGRTGDPAIQRQWTDEFLCNLNNERGVGGYDHGNRTYDGQDNNNIFIKAKKLSKLVGGASASTDTSKYDGRDKVRVPELWIVYRRDDTGTCEIWIGYKQGAVQPLYRLYPNTCAEYRE